MTASLKPSLLRISQISLAATLAAALTGCAVDRAAGPVDTIASPISGIIHGGPNPVVGAKVVMYATTSAGYGNAGTALQEATQVGGSLHQDTSAAGNFSFAGGYTCPAGQFAYVVAYGGNSGAGNNPNSVLMAALGPCSSLFTGTLYTGPTIWIDELTTVAAGYALSNFISFTGNSVAGYAVGISADATNSAANSAAACVANLNYPGCTTTQAAGMAHAFTMAGNLVSTSTGQVVNNTTTNLTANGALIPAQEINTLGNILQACVNSTGGGTSLTTGLPTTTTTSSGTTYDGTVCGALSAFTSYTLNGTATGTVVAAGNTLGYIQNLAKRPSGIVTNFASTCASGSTGSTSAASCLFNLAPSNGFYSLAMTAAPNDWMLGLSYLKGSFSTAVTSTTCGSSITLTTLGTYYPYSIATDINDDIAILNESDSTGICYNLLTIGFDGTPIGANAFDTSTADPLNVAYDSFGHAIVGGHTSGTANNQINVYDAGSTDVTIPRVATVTAASSGVAALTDVQYVAVDGHDNIFFTSRGAVNDDGVIEPTSPESHALPTYTTGVNWASTASMNELFIDPNNIDFAITSSGSGTGHVFGLPIGLPAIATTPGDGETGSSAFGSSSSTSHSAIATDTSGNAYLVLLNTTSPASTVVLKLPYTDTATTLTFGTVPTVSAPTASFAVETIEPTVGTMDGNNVMWFAEFGNASIVVGPPPIVTSGHVAAYDTVNNFPSPNYQGCVFLNTTNTVCGSTSTTTGSSVPYLAYLSRYVAVDSSGNLWVANGSPGTISEIIGIAAPTWPLFIHNGTSFKP